MQNQQKCTLNSIRSDIDYYITIFLYNNNILVSVWICESAFNSFVYHLGVCGCTLSIRKRQNGIVFHMKIIRRIMIITIAARGELFNYLCNIY